MSTAIITRPDYVQISLIENGVILNTTRIARSGLADAQVNGWVRSL